MGLINVNNENVCPEDSPGSNISQYTALSYRWRFPESGLLSCEFLDGMVDEIFDDWKTVWEAEETNLSLPSDKGFHNDLRLGKLVVIDEQSYFHGRRGQKDDRILPEALDRTMTKISRGLIGDEGIGPLAGKPSMGREDDDDDDCVGFRRLSPKASHGSGLHYEIAGLLAGASSQHLGVGGLCGVVPKYGPPKRDPVAAAISTPLMHPTQESTLNMWRGAIARTCGAGTGPNAGKWKCCVCKYVNCNISHHAYGEGGLLSAH